MVEDSKFARQDKYDFDHEDLAPEAYIVPDVLPLAADLDDPCRGLRIDIYGILISNREPMTEQEIVQVYREDNDRNLKIEVTQLGFESLNQFLVANPNKFMVIRNGTKTLYCARQAEYESTAHLQKLVRTQMSGGPMGRRSRSMGPPSGMRAPLRKPTSYGMAFRATDQSQQQHSQGTSAPEPDASRLNSLNRDRARSAHPLSRFALDRPNAQDQQPEPVLQRHQMPSSSQTGIMSRVSYGTSAHAAPNNAQGSEGFYPFGRNTPEHSEQSEVPLQSSPRQLSRTELRSLTQCIHSLGTEQSGRIVMPVEEALRAVNFGRDGGITLGGRDNPLTPKTLTEAVRYAQNRIGDQLMVEVDDDDGWPITLLVVPKRSQVQSAAKPVGQGLVSPPTSQHNTQSDTSVTRTPRLSPVGLRHVNAVLQSNISAEKRKEASKMRERDGTAAVKAVTTEEDLTQNIVKNRNFFYELRENVPNLAGNVCKGAEELQLLRTQCPPVRPEVNGSRYINNTNQRTKTRVKTKAPGEGQESPFAKLRAQPTKQTVQPSVADDMKKNMVGDEGLICTPTENSHGDRRVMGLLGVNNKTASTNSLASMRRASLHTGNVSQAQSLPTPAPRAALRAFNVQQQGLPVDSDEGDSSFSSETDNECTNSNANVVSERMSNANAKPTKQVEDVLRSSSRANEHQKNTAAAQKMVQPAGRSEVEEQDQESEEDDEYERERKNLAIEWAVKKVRQSLKENVPLAWRSNTQLRALETVVHANKDKFYCGENLLLEQLVEDIDEVRLDNFVTPRDILRECATEDSDATPPSKYFVGVPLLGLHPHHILVLRVNPLENDNTADLINHEIVSRQRRRLECSAEVAYRYGKLCLIRHGELWKRVVLTKFLEEKKAWQVVGADSFVSNGSEYLEVPIDSLYSLPEECAPQHIPTLLFVARVRGVHAVNMGCRDQWRGFIQLYTFELHAETEDCFLGCNYGSKNVPTSVDESGDSTPVVDFFLSDELQYLSTALYGEPGSPIDPASHDVSKHPLFSVLGPVPPIFDAAEAFEFADKMRQEAWKKSEQSLDDLELDAERELESEVVLTNGQEQEQHHVVEEEDSVDREFRSASLVDQHRNKVIAEAEMNSDTDVTREEEEPVFDEQDRVRNDEAVDERRSTVSSVVEEWLNKSVEVPTRSEQNETSESRVRTAFGGSLPWQHGAKPVSVEVSADSSHGRQQMERRAPANVSDRPAPEGAFTAVSAVDDQQTQALIFPDTNAFQTPEKMDPVPKAPAADDIEALFGKLTTGLGARVDVDGPGGSTDAGKDQAQSTSNCVLASVQRSEALDHVDKDGLQAVFMEACSRSKVACCAALTLLHIAKESENGELDPLVTNMIGQVEELYRKC